MKEFNSPSSIPSHIQATMRSGDRLVDNLFYKMPFSRCVNRVEWIAEQCNGKNVIDVGCVDETAFEAKIDTTKWLHGQIKNRASSVLGLDNSLRLAELKRQFPLHLSAVLGGSLQDLDATCRNKKFQPDLIICGELIEHLAEPEMLFRLVGSVLRERGGRLIVTTPNPYGYQNFLMALLGFESQHVDHTCILSAKIQMRMADKYGFRLCDLRTAYTEYSELRRRSGWMTSFLIGTVDVLIFRPLQWIRPSLGGTLITVWETA